MKKNLLLLTMTLVLLTAGCGAKNRETPQGSHGQACIPLLEAYMESAEERGAALETSLERDVLTQTDMNLKSRELYELWDEAMKYVWGELEAHLPEQTFAQLSQDQRAWEQEREQRMEEAGKSVEGGTMYALVVNTQAASVTRARVYELCDILKQANRA